ncbi:Cupin superfamily protein [Aureococcus anophagefferens]|uniref:peptidylprolyl isomerase n=1 Tax=Aureococcus anophagefferens TaxID=44056 RepID=A0ABR1FQG3_AURAN
MDVKNYGSVVIELEDTKVPTTVDNFLSYVDDEYYDELVFHRVIKGFMIQGAATTASRPGLDNDKGTIAMARRGRPDATSQFFINTVDNGSLDPGMGRDGYCAFGTVVEGMGVPGGEAEEKGLQYSDQVIKVGDTWCDGEDEIKAAVAKHRSGPSCWTVSRKDPRRERREDHLRRGPTLGIAFCPNGTPGMLQPGGEAEEKGLQYSDKKPPEPEFEGDPDEVLLEICDDDEGMDFTPAIWVGCDPPAGYAEPEPEPEPEPSRAEASAPLGPAPTTIDVYFDGPSLGLAFNADGTVKGLQPGGEAEQASRALMERLAPQLRSHWSRAAAHLPAAAPEVASLSLAHFDDHVDAGGFLGASRSAPSADSGWAEVACAPPRRRVVEPGDAVYVPAGWPHATDTLLLGADRPSPGRATRPAAARRSTSLGLDHAVFSLGAPARSGAAGASDAALADAAVALPFDALTDVRARAPLGRAAATAGRRSPDGKGARRAIAALQRDLLARTRVAFRF